MTTATQGELTYTENPIIQSFLNRRELGVQDIDYLLNPNASHQHDPFLLKGIGQWIDTLHAIKGQCLAIIPDYDADGVLSGTLARVGLSLFGFGDVYVYPPKTRDGYGLTKASVDNVLKAQPATNVILTTDNGSNAHEGIAYAKSLGLMVLVTDHHLAQEAPQADAVVNPNGHGDNTYPFSQISGTAVIYKVLLAYGRKYIGDSDILCAFDDLVLLVGISTISDVMPMLNENRYFVTQSVNMLKRFVEGHSIERIDQYDDTPLSQYYRGVDLLVATLNKHKKLNYGIDSDTFGFLIGPILNSPRRMVGESNLGFNLFQTKRNELLAAQGALPSDDLFDMNESRKAYVRKLTIALFDYIEASEQEALEHVVFNAVMGSGIAGLLSGKFTEKYGLPSIAFGAEGASTPDDDPINVDVTGCKYLVGSARSPESFDLHKFLSVIDSENPGLIESWGGHEQAAGIKVKAENYLQFQTIFTERFKHILASQVAEMDTQDDERLPFNGEYVITSDAYDRLVSMYDEPACSIIRVATNTPLFEDDIVRESVRFFEQLEPFGQGFAKPLFSTVVWMRDVKAFFMGTEKQHVKLTLPNGLAVIYWNGAALFAYDEKDEAGKDLQDNRVFILTGNLSVNEYNGRESLQIIANDVVQVY